MEQLLIGDAAKALNIREWQLRRLCEGKNRVPFEQIGRYRVFRRRDFPRIRAEAVRRGYLAASAAESATTQS